MQHNYTTLVRVSNVCLSYSGRDILTNINLSIKQNEIVTIIGPNGSGKTSLLRLLIKVIRPNKGSIEYMNNCKVTYIPQDLHFNSILSIKVEYFFNLLRCKHDLAELIDGVGIRELLHKQLHTISKGELQKVFLVYCLSKKPHLMILDEPMSSMDIQSQNAFYTLINRIKSRYSCTIIMTSHDLHTVMRNTDRVICLNRYIRCAGEPKDITSDPVFTELFGENVAFYKHLHDKDNCSD